MKNFGVGQLVLNPGGTNPTPVQLSILQDVDLDFSFTEKELYGQFQLPVDVARGEMKLGLKAKEAHISAMLMGSFFAGSTTAAGYTSSAINEASTIPATPFQITVINSATFVADCGVVDLTSGIVMTNVAGPTPTTGQYTVAAGVYTFALADVGHVIWISYTYTVAGAGKTVHYNNPLMGTGASYSVTLFNIFRTKVLGFKFYAVTVPKLSMPLKNNDYTILGLDMGVYQDSLGNVLEYYESDF
jgi:hypothetical protein